MKEHYQNGILQVLNDHPIIPVITINKQTQVDEIVQQLIEQNIRCIEITLRTGEGWDAIEQVMSEYGSEMKIGVGTITKVQQVEHAYNLGVDFIVSPGLTPSLLEAMIKFKTPFLPGVSNVGQIMMAHEYQCNVLKFFPAMMSGGIEALRMFKQLFPDTMFCPTGGISEDNHQEFLSQPNVVSVGGSWVAAQQLS